MRLPRRRKKPKTSDVLKLAVQQDDLTKIGAIVDGLRFKHGFTYDGVQKFFERHVKMDVFDFEILMQRIDLEGP